MWYKYLKPGDVEWLSWQNRWRPYIFRRKQNFLLSQIFITLEGCKHKISNVLIHRSHSDNINRELILYRHPFIDNRLRTQGLERGIVLILSRSFRASELGASAGDNLPVPLLLSSWHLQHCAVWLLNLTATQTSQQKASRKIMQALLREGF